MPSSVSFDGVGKHTGPLLSMGNRINFPTKFQPFCFELKTLYAVTHQLARMFVTLRRHLVLKSRLVAVTRYKVRTYADV